MKRTSPVIAIGALLLMLFGLSMTGYDIRLSSDALLYSDDRNAPFEDREVSARIGKEEVISVYGCFDDKTDLYFYAMRSDGVYGYLYEKKYKAIKNWIPKMGRIAYFFHEPLASIQCLVMVPELSS